MNWIVTSTGAEFDFKRPRPDTIRAEDIANALSKINRFTGHTCRPYSVAEHCMLVHELVQIEFAVQQPQVLLAALLHDAHEAYCGDTSTPAKRAIGWQWYDFEQPLENAVLHKFGVLRDARVWASVIKTCDTLALAIERRDLLPPPSPDSRPWPSLEGVVAPSYINLMSGHHAGYIWQDWRDVYLEKLCELHYAVHGDAAAADASAAPAGNTAAVTP